MVAVAACSRSEDQIEFERQAYQVPDNYTRTSAGGIVDTSHVDETDWQIGPRFQAFIDVTIPAYPNPTRNERVEVELLVSGSGSIDGIYAYAYPEAHDFSHRRRLDEVDRTLRNLETIVLSIDPADFAFNGVYSNALQVNNGLHRLYIYDRNNNLITYGDIQLKR